MKIYKKLAGQTLVYGAGTIVPKVLNYVILTAYYTRLFRPEQFGIITELYAYVTFLMVILTYGTETGFFKFARDGKESTAFSSLMICLSATSLFFVLLVVIFKNYLARLLDYSGNENYIVVLGLIVGIDALSTIFFAKIRIEENSVKFSWLKVLNVIITIVAVLVFYELIPYVQLKYKIWLGLNTANNILYVLYANLIASSVILLILVTEVMKVRLVLDLNLLKEILGYSFPLLLAGLAGTINETLDRVLLKHFVTEPDKALYVLGIYGANYRVAMILSIFVQMFRYAVEPFYFNYHGKENEKAVFAGIMRLFIGVMITLIMIILFFLDYIKFFIAPEYHDGIRVIPVVLIAFLFYGIFFNQSIWYKLTKNTIYAIVLTLLGALITIIANVFFVGRFSYMASAFGHLFAYLAMMIVSFIIGRKYYVIDYKIGKIFEYILAAGILFSVQLLFLGGTGFIKDVLSVILILIYVVYYLFREELIFKTISKKNIFNHEG